jgi:hypothetical protein
LARTQSRYSGLGGRPSRTSLAAGSRHQSAPPARGIQRWHAAPIRRQGSTGEPLGHGAKGGIPGDGPSGPTTSSATGPRRAQELSCVARMLGATLPRRVPTGSRVDLVKPLVTLLGSMISRRALDAASGRSPRRVRAVSALLVGIRFQPAPRRLSIKGMYGERGCRYAGWRLAVVPKSGHGNRSTGRWSLAYAPRAGMQWRRAPTRN